MKRAFVLIAFLALLVPAALIADTVVEEIVARVNGDVITTSDYRRGLEQLRNDLRQQVGPSEADQLLKDRQKDLLRDLIDQQLLLEKGKELGITGDTELVKRLDELRKQNNIASMEDLEKMAEQQGVNFEDFKQQIRNGIITQQVISQEVGRKIRITEEEGKKYYEEHSKQLERPEQVRLSEILVAVDKDAAPDQVTAAEAKADELLKQIRGGAKFEEVAQKASQGPTAGQGGDLGLFKRGTLAKELEDRVFAMQPGQASDVVRTKQGFVILMVTEHQAAGVPSFKEVEGKIADAMYFERLQPTLRAYLTKLREESSIEIKQGYVDSGASPNQTNPVFTASQSEQAAEQAKKKKKRFILF